jgi:hypothetical protein
MTNPAVRTLSKSMYLIRKPKESDTGQKYDVSQKSETESEESGDGDHGNSESESETKSEEDSSSPVTRKTIRDVLQSVQDAINAGIKLTIKDGMLVETSSAHFLNESQLSLLASLLKCASYKGIKLTAKLYVTILNAFCTDE